MFTTLIYFIILVFFVYVFFTIRERILQVSQPNGMCAFSSKANLVFRSFFRRRYRTSWGTQI